MGTRTDYVRLTRMPSAFEFTRAYALADFVRRWTRDFVACPRECRKKNVKDLIAADSGFRK
jgi:hypothetical protein